MNITLKVAVIIGNSQKEILLLKEKYSKYSDFKWNLIKGTYDNAEETIEECARREIREEVGLNVGKMTLKKIYQYGDESGQRILFIFYADYHESNKPTTKNKMKNEYISEIKWFSKKELASLPENSFMAPYIYAVILEKN